MVRWPALARGLLFPLTISVPSHRPRKTTSMEQHYSVLIVDDDDTLRATLKKILTKAGYQAQAAKDGLEALDLFTEHPPDLVLADLKMPRKNGLSLLGEIHERKPDCKVIIMTAYGDQDTCSEALRRGACAYLNKPVSRAELLALCSKALGEP